MHNTKQLQQLHLKKHTSIQNNFYDMHQQKKCTYFSYNLRFKNPLSKNTDFVYKMHHQCCVSKL